MQIEKPIVVKNCMTATSHTPDSNRRKIFRNGLLAFPDSSFMACLKHMIITLLGLPASSVVKSLFNNVVRGFSLVKRARL
jgi:hypothetical protein